MSVNDMKGHYCQAAGRWSEDIEPDDCNQCAALETMIKERGTCEACRFFMKEKPYDIAGTCRRRSPQSVAWTSHPYPGDPEAVRMGVRSGIATQWPNVSPHEWCAEFERKTEAKP